MPMISIDILKLMKFWSFHLYKNQPISAQEWLRTNFMEKWASALLYISEDPQGDTWRKPTFCFDITSNKCSKVREVFVFKVKNTVHIYTRNFKFNKNANIALLKWEEEQEKQGEKQFVMIRVSRICVGETQIRTKPIRSDLTKAIKMRSNKSH